MNDPADIARTVLDRVTMMEAILIEAATGGSRDNHIYGQLRRQFMADPDVCDLLPRFVRTLRSLDAFWSYIKNEAAT